MSSRYGSVTCASVLARWSRWWASSTGTPPSSKAPARIVLLLASRTLQEHFGDLQPMNEDEGIGVLRNLTLRSRGEVGRGDIDAKPPSPQARHRPG